MKRAAVNAAVKTVETYQKLISPYLIRSCRFYPTCSDYAKEALSKFGFFRGSALALWRILRCNPLSRGGFDPVVKAGSDTLPAKKQENSNAQTA